MGGITTHAYLLAARILNSKGHFATDVTFDNRNETVVVCPALVVRHHLKGIDMDGNVVDGLVARVTVSEKQLVDLEYPVRNIDKLVAMKDHRVSYTDENGIARDYIIKQQLPSDTIGVLMFGLAENKINER